MTCDVCESLGYPCTQHRVGLGKEIKAAVAAERSRIADLIGKWSRDAEEAAAFYDTVPPGCYEFMEAVLKRLESEVRG